MVSIDETKIVRMGNDRGGRWEKVLAGRFRRKE